MFKKAFCSIFSILTTSVYPATIVDHHPIGIIEGTESMINHPEGIAFSPSGNLVAIANAGGSNVLFFQASDCCSTGTKSQPVFVINGLDSPLKYPHDLDFTLDGEHLAVACPGDNRVIIYKRNVQSGFYEEKPLAVIEGSKGGLLAISAVKYCPNGNYLGVCDVAGYQIALYHYNGENYDSMPYQVIRAPSDILKQPDGLGFSKDGKWLAVTSHGNHSVLIFERKFLSQEYSNTPAEILKGEETLFTFTHSLCFHPIDDTLIVSSAGGRKTLSLFKKISELVPRYTSSAAQAIEIYNPETIYMQEFYPEEGGVKGITISPDGKILGICAGDIVNTCRSIQFFSISFQIEKDQNN